MTQLFLILSLGWALKGWSETQSIPFYRSTLSQFPSGEASIIELKSKLKRTQFEPWCLVQADNDQAWIPQSQLFFLRDFHQPTPATNVALVKKESPSLRNKLGWRPDKNVKAGTLFRTDKVHSDWTCGTDRKGPICVETSNLIFSFDLAQALYDKSGNRFPLRKRENHRFFIGKSKNLLFSQIKDFEPHPSYAFIKSSEFKSNPIQVNGPRPTRTDQTQWSHPLMIPFRRVEIITTELRQWKQSLIANHGLVWWNERDLPSGLENRMVFTTDETLSRPIFDRATQKNLNILSADGIFLSRDGQVWEFLENFGNNNYPVQIGPRNVLIVGDQISYDQGQSFHPYLKWDEVAFLSQRRLGVVPKRIQLKKIKKKESNQIEVLIDTGYSEVAFGYNIVTRRLKTL